MKSFSKSFFIIHFILGFANLSAAQANDECVDMEFFCPNPGLTFTANATGINAMAVQPTNNYECLSSTPNATWYFCQILTSGNINMNLFAASDIDYIIYGPFNDTLEAMASCGNMGNGGAGGNVIDCSYSGTNNEFPNIPNGIVGEVYVILITNYASILQELTITQIGGIGEVSCSIITGVSCLAHSGTYLTKKNGAPTSSPISLCLGDSFEIISNGDYVLPLDTIPAPSGDGIYSAQLMWLLYDAEPTEANPSFDPAFLFDIITDENISDINSLLSPIVDDYGCGTYWFVPVTGDDGIGGNNNVANGVNDNGGLHWDRDGNGCYVLGTPVQVTYACAIQTNVSINCNVLSEMNTINVNISGGVGFYTVINLGDGNLASTAVPNGGFAQINNLENGNNWELKIIDQSGCSNIVNGTFNAPQFSNITIVPAITCPLGGNGTVNVTVDGTSGNGAPYTIYMANDPGTLGLTDNYSNVAGTLVSIIIADNLGCSNDSIITITSSGHFINITSSVQNETCYSEGNGEASIIAVPTPSGSITNITWTGPSGQHPGGNPGGPANNSQLFLEAGNWIVTVVDDTGCEVTVPVEIESPQQLSAYSNNSINPSCFGSATGSFNIESNGGTLPYSYSYNINNPIAGNTNLIAGNYWVYSFDQNGCMDSLEIILTQPDSLFFSILGSDNDPGSANGNVYCLGSGGYPNYSYLWTNLNDLTTHNESNWENVTAGVYQIILTDASGCQLIDTVSVGFVGIEENMLNFHLYPNPVNNDNLMVEINDENNSYRFSIFNLQGKLVGEFELQNGINQLPFSFANGIYTYSITNDVEKLYSNETGKIIVLNK